VNTRAVRYMGVRGPVEACGGLSAEIFISVEVERYEAVSGSERKVRPSSTWVAPGAPQLIKYTSLGSNSVPGAGIA
jgi:hypothetical protein